MPGCVRSLSLAALLTCGLGTAVAQPFSFERPAPYVPARPTSKQDIDRRESLKYYVLGLLCVREDRLLEAVERWEDGAAPGRETLLATAQALDAFVEEHVHTRK